MALRALLGLAFWGSKLGWASEGSPSADCLLQKQRSVFRDDASRQFSDLHGDLQGQALSKKIAALADSMEPGVTRDLLNSFRICGSCKDFRRFGEHLDGGYLICMDHLAKGDIQAAYSMGIDDHDLWSKDIYTNYGVPVFQYDCTVDKAAQDCDSCSFYKSCLKGEDDGVEDPMNLTLKQVKPIEESSAHQYDVPAEFNNVKTYYFGAELRPCCSVRGFLFTALSYDFSIRVVAEHLIPRRQAMAASLVGIDVHDERNGVILCKQLERLLQAGQWSLVPVSCDASANMLSCRIHVSNTELETELNDIGFVDSERRPLLAQLASGRSIPLKMKDLHGQLVTMRKPYIRSLLLKNLMACKKNPELPNPLHGSRLSDYISWCSSLERFNMDMVLAAGDGSEERDEAQPEVCFKLRPPSWIGEGNSFARESFEKEVITDEHGIDISNYQICGVLTKTSNARGPDRSLLMKMDIEGGEWQALGTASDETLRKFRQLVVEFHWLGDEEQHVQFVSTLRRLKEAGFRVVHLHGNNAARMYEYGDFRIPHVLEVTLDSQGPEIPCITDEVRSQLDHPNLAAHRPSEARYLMPPNLRDRPFWDCTSFPTYWSGNGTAVNATPMELHYGGAAIYRLAMLPSASIGVSKDDADWQVRTKILAAGTNGQPAEIRELRPGESTTFEGEPRELYVVQVNVDPEGETLSRDDKGSVWAREDCKEVDPSCQGKAWTTASQGGLYPNLATAGLRSPLLELPKAGNLTMNLTAWWDMEEQVGPFMETTTAGCEVKGWDGVQVRLHIYKTPGIETEQHGSGDEVVVLRPKGGYDDLETVKAVASFARQAIDAQYPSAYRQDCASQDGWTGRSHGKGFTSHLFDLNAFGGQRARIEVLFASDASFRKRGFWLKDLNVRAGNKEVFQDVEALFGTILVYTPPAGQTGSAGVPVVVQYPDGFEADRGMQKSSQTRFAPFWATWKQGPQWPESNLRRQSIPKSTFVSVKDRARAPPAV
ncbi:hypothetical protein AK812_SmicGene43516 [Symbiodinium microadriaticum]|uniref:Methyltransferase FkbM domain-containing protein n=1 Tax=Symbiodinium microadriaticum TaxID=2951 RepID=A0A1Q9C0U1_SYMMI|nr:hypothetical protein AK812_SmicGene43516 [Symbiodinium microadriaticum]